MTQNDNAARFRALLAELLMLDQADLDFGIYRIMNARRAEITRFLDEDLLPQIHEELQRNQSGDREALQRQLAEVIEAARAAGFDATQAENAPKALELRAKISDAMDVPRAEREVFNHLYNFFSRYYQEGDFLSLRRYKRDVYALPYEGEEVKLHWANADQYYIKTSEFFRDYIFTLTDGRRVHFKLAAADTEQNNNKATGERERRFMLASASDFLRVENDELIVSFTYQPDAEKRKQADINRETVRAVFDALGAGAPSAPAKAAKKGRKKKGGEVAAVASVSERESSGATNTALLAWAKSLMQPVGTNGNPERTTLEKHLNDYTAKNSFDYFIHKDLSSFLRRELDFYIKNEVMFLDDIERESAQRVENYLAVVRAIRRVGLKIIGFLASLEDFQKRLWLKKKFVVETHWCVTLDHVPEEFYAEIAANEQQRAEWVRLFAINEINGNLLDAAYSEPLTVEFLQTQPHLLLNTRLFDRDFTERLLATFDDLEEQTDGVLIESENFQALNLLQARYREQFKCIYIDPPYNTPSSSILYKNDYQHSTWCTLIRDRAELSKRLLQPDGAIFVSIDKTERTNLEYAMDEVFGTSNHIEELIWAQNTANSQLPNYATNHEYVEVYAADRKAVEQDVEMFREPKPGYAEIMDLIARIQPEFPSLATVEAEIQNQFDLHIASYKEELEANGREWDDETKRQDPWRGIYPYKRAEYRDKDGSFVSEQDAKKRGATIWIWREISPAAPASKQAASTRDPQHHNYRYYKPLHPVTRKPSPHPRGGWKFPYSPDPSTPARRSFVELDADKRIVWGTDERKVPQTKGFIHEVETNIGTSVFYEYNDGEAELANMFGESGLFLSPKSSRFVRKFVAQATKKDSLFTDFFGGSGSSGHAVISQNRLDHGARKYVLVEMGAHFNSLMLPRVLKAIYSQDWRDGKPVSRVGSSGLVKIFRLESYEDAMNNLTVSRTSQQSDLLALHGVFREQYTLRYLFERETASSASLLNLDLFENPFDYRLDVSAGGSSAATISTAVDLIETFNYLLGLRVTRRYTRAGFRVIEGADANGSRTLIIWRNAREQDNDALNSFFTEQGYGARGFSVVYANGDHTLGMTRRNGETWQDRMIEMDFKRLMFEEAV